MWSIWVDGVEHRLDDVPLGRLIEAGIDLSDMRPHERVTDAAALAQVLVGHSDVRLSDIRPSAVDLPSYWTDGRPTGGRPLDGWVRALCRPPWSFTPRQIREDFTLRDLELIGVE